MDVGIESRRFVDSDNRYRKCYGKYNAVCVEGDNGRGYGDDTAVVYTRFCGYGHGVTGTHGSLRNGGSGYGCGHMK